MCEANKPGESVTAGKKVIDQGANVSDPKKIVFKIAQTEQEVSTGCANVVKPKKWRIKRFWS